MNMRTRLTAAALLAATAFGLATAPGSPAGADAGEPASGAASTTPTPASKAASKTFSFGGFTGNSQYNTETFTAPGTTPVIGNFGGSSGTDILWYTAGNGGDELWTNTGPVEFSHTATSINGSFTPEVGTFSAADGYQDVLWYSTTGASQLWDFNANGSITKTTLPGVTGPGQIVVGDFALDGIDDIVRYRPGTASDSWWDFQTMSVAGRAFNVNGTYTPVVGELTQNGSDDILWYAPGTNPDALWDFTGGGAKTEWKLTINGTYTPVVGSFSSDGIDDIVWYKAGAGADSYWDFDGSGHTSKALSVNGTYAPVACICFPNMHESIIWFAGGNAPDVGWWMNGDQLAHTSVTGDVLGSSVAGDGLFGTNTELLLVRH